MLSPVRLIQEHRRYPEIQAESLEDVVQYGLEHLPVNSQGNYLIEDSGLSISALGGFPRVYSAYIYHTLGLPGILKLLEGETNRKATFHSVIGFRESTGSPQIFEGVCEGKITTHPRGEKGFGYDPIFIPTGSSSTFAEMSYKEKNMFSHRGKATRKLKEYLLSNKKGDIGGHD